MQQINLYLPEFRPNREPLRSIHMVWGLLALIALLGLFSAFSSYRNHSLEQQIVQEQDAAKNLQLELQKINLQQSPRQTALLENEIQRLQHERNRRQQILMVISQQDLGNSKGFSPQMQAMARQSLDTLALESFSFQQGGSYVEFSGKTRQADQVPLYLQRLRDEPSFTSVRFGVLNLERQADLGAILNFQLAKPETSATEGKK